MMAVRRPELVGPITIGHGVNEFFSIVIPPVIPLLVTDLGITYAQAGFLLTAFFLMYSVFQLPAGVLADRIGKGRLLIAGLVGMSIGIVLAATADGYGMLLVAQSVAGIGGSTFHPTGMSMISDVETASTEGRAMGVFGFGGAVGTLASPAIIGGLALIGGWRIALGTAGLLGLVVAVGFIPLLRGMDRREGHEPDDDPRTDGGERPSMGPLERLRGSIGVPLGPAIAVLFLATLTLSLQHRAIHTFTTAYVVAETGASVGFGNYVYFLLLLGASLSSLWAGSLADRIDRPTLGSSTALLTALLVGATVTLPWVLGGLPAWAIIPTLSVWFFLIGVMMYAAYPVKNALASEYAETGHSGGLFGIIQTASALGSAIGPALFGVLSTRWGVIAAFPVVAVVSLSLATLFLLLRWL